MTQKKASTEEVFKEFDSVKSKLDDLCHRTKQLLEEALKDKNLKFQSIAWRVKDREKLKRKYEDPEKSYSTLSDITDLAGLRIITYLSREIDAVKEVVQREFDLDQKNSVDKRKDEDPTRLGYQSLHCVCRYPDRRLTLFEYSKFSGVKFEVQITSILQHAWAELEHGAYDKGKNIPYELRTRFSCLSGLLQLADREFASLLDDQEKYAKSTAVMVEANVPDLSSVNLDALSLPAFVESNQLVKELDNWIAALAEVKVERDKQAVRLMNGYSLAANFVGLKTLGDLSNALREYEPQLKQFEEKANDWKNRPDPNRPLPVGVSVYRLTLLLAARQGAEFTTKMLESVGMNFEDNSSWIATLVAAAQQTSDNEKI